MAEAEAPPTLSDLPDVPLKLITRYCDFKAVQNLRKSCHRLRDYLSAQPPNSNFETIHITNNDDVIKLIFTVKLAKNNEINETIIEYEHNSNGCNIKNLNSGKGKFLENENFQEIFSNDVTILLKSQKLALDVFKIESKNEWIWNFLENFFIGFHHHFFRVHRLELSIDDQDEVMSILQYLCPDTIYDINLKTDCETLELDDVIDLVQWKRAVNVYVSPECAINVPIGCFKNCGTAGFKVGILRMEDVETVKEILLKSRFGCMSFDIHFDQFPDSHKIAETYGPHYSGLIDLAISESDEPLLTLARNVLNYGYFDQELLDDVENARLNRAWYFRCPPCRGDGPMMFDLHSDCFSAHYGDWAHPPSDATLINL